MIHQLFKKKAEQQNCDITQEQCLPPYPLFFVHIPKTAGTSFRKGLEAIQPMEKDYGASATETSPIIRTHMYGEHNPYALKQAMLECPYALTGHVHIQKYADFFNVRQILTFVREPIAQIVSHYNHFVNHNGFLDDFAKFYRSVQFRNVQSGYLNGFPLSLIGFVGVTEHYNESLDLINRGLGLDMDPLKRNIGTQAHQKTDSLPKPVVDELLKLNQQDLSLYNNALELHRQRMDVVRQGNEWVHIHAYVNPNDVLHGCAYHASSEKPVRLMVKINGEEQSTLTAKEFFGQFPKFNFPRQRYVGFSFPLAKLREAGISDVELIVCETGQSYCVELPSRFHLEHNISHN